jgi:hypothetical protein
MNNSIIPENPISPSKNTTEEKSKKRAVELKASINKLAMPKLVSESSQAPDKHPKTTEDVIVDELNRILAIVHTSSTYILIEKSETEFVLDSKTSLLLLYENQVVPELSKKGAKRPTTKAHVWLKSSRRRTFQNIVFNPKVIGHYDGNFNIWKGFAVKAKKAIVHFSGIM